ncbi:MAG: hypothetical protein CL920_31690 [Deltaproteobacteria bacterium]|nr:hypothetical protein [Deltaproteobacteria bacterium]MBU53282.1 hypothetical protein [Deltaproteobacteria bacterium]
MEHFAEIRRMLSVSARQHRPVRGKGGGRVWRRLVEILRDDGWSSEAERQMALAYLGVHLSSWDDETRIITPGKNMPLHVFFRSFYEQEPFWEIVRTLRLNGHSFVDDELLHLDAPASQKSITQLHLSSCHLSKDDLDILFSSGGWPALRKLMLAGNYMQKAGAEVLARAPQLSTLEALHLPHTGSEEGVVALAKSPHLRSLHVLNVDHCFFNPATVVKVAECEGWPDLEDLSLGGLRGGSSGKTDWIKAWSGHPMWDSLQALSMESSVLTADNFKKLLKAWRLPQLRALNMSNNPIGDQGVEELLKWSGLELLESLSLSHCSIRSRGLERILESPRLQHLRSLSLDGNHWELKEYKKLVSAPYLSSLTHLNVSSVFSNVNMLEVFLETTGLESLQELRIKPLYYHNGAAYRELVKKLKSTERFAAVKII